MFRALLVETDCASREAREALAHAGCVEIWCAPTCEAAVALVRRDRLTPDLIVVELRDPDPRALAPLRRLRNVPVIAIVDEPADGTTTAARIADAVTRPVRRAELLARIRASLRLRSERARWAARERALGDEIQRLQRENHELERLVCVDSLTGVSNRRHVLSLLVAEWKRAARERTPLALVMLDLDYFHAYNELYGHPGGDEALRRAARALVGCLRRPSDFLGRYGGEEFVVILGDTDAAGARVVAERLRATVEALAIPHNGSGCARVVTLSAGFAAVHPTPETSPDELVIAADSALLRAKELGRNRIEGDAPHAQAPGYAPGAPAVPGPDAWWHRTPAVIVDPWFADRVPQFLDGVRADVRSIHDVRSARDLERVRAIARKLKAAARELGFEEVRRLAVQLERAGKVPDRDAIRTTADELLQYVAHVRVVYRRQTTELAPALQA